MVTCRAASEVFCDKQIHAKVKGKFYWIALFSALLYGTKYWANKCGHIDKMGMSEIYMLRWMSSKTLKDQIPDNTIYAQLGRTQ